MAKETAIRGSSIRRHRIGAVGIRTDGVIVKSPNGSNRLPAPEAHAEAKVCRKMDWGGVVYVVRVLRSGHLALARPCSKCQSTMRNSGVRHCYYSINDSEIGVIEL